MVYVVNSYHGFLTPDFPRSAIRYVISHIVGYLSGYFKAIEKRYDEPFFQTVQSNLMVFGFKDGHFFDAQYETEEAFQQAVKELPTQEKPGAV